MHSIYRSATAKASFLALYQEKLESLDIPFELRLVETSFGSTNIILVEREKAPPMVLIHAWNACAPMALEDFSGLSKDFSVYAIDVLGQPNLSAEDRPNIHGAAYGEWLYEIISFLNLQQVYLVGVSFGAFIGWKGILHDARRIHKAFFINPMGIVGPNVWQRFWQIQAPVYLYKYWPSPQLNRWHLQGMYTTPNTFTKRWAFHLLTRYNWNLKSIPAVSSAQAQLVHTPIYVIGSSLDALAPGQWTLTKSKDIFPSFAGGLVLKNGKHFPNIAGYREIVAFIKQHQ